MVSSITALTLVVMMAAIGPTAGAGNGEACRSDSDCTVDNQECIGEGYYTSGSCDRGKCECSDGYIWDSPKCKTKKNDGDDCVDADDKCVAGTCASGTCTCPVGTTYNSELEDCLTNGKKLLDETCTTVTDCYGTTGTVKCDTTCQCETGYIQEAQICRPPHALEACIATDANPPGVECASALSDDTSIVTETCVNDVCKCPDEKDPTSIKIKETTYKVCLNDYDGALRKDGATCMTHTSCQSTYCGICPGDSVKTCIRASTANPLPHHLAYLVVFMLLLLLKLV